MARYVNQLSLRIDPMQAQQTIAGFLTHKGFEPYQSKGENCWKKGMGFFAAPQFIKTTVTGNVIVVEAWLKSAILPGVYVGEMGLTGAMGFAVKAALRSTVRELESYLGVPMAPPAPYGQPMPQQPMQPMQPQPPQPGASEQNP